MEESEPGERASPNESVVVFFRRDVTGIAEVFPIYVDDKLAGYSERRCYFEVRCEPGEHVFRSPPSSLGVDNVLLGTLPPDAILTAELAPGKVYFVETWLTGGGCNAIKTGLRPITRDQGRWERIEKTVSRLQPRRLRDGPPTIPRQQDLQFKEIVQKGRHLEPEDGR
jgi:hypothetical protein